MFASRSPTRTRRPWRRSAGRRHPGGEDADAPVRLGGHVINPAMGSTPNPWSLDHISGGSSGGSAVAVAAGLVPIALARTPRGRSGRSAPVWRCGIQAPYGRVSLEGVFPLAGSLDHAARSRGRPPTRPSCSHRSAGMRRSRSATSRRGRSPVCAWAYLPTMTTWRSGTPATRWPGPGPSWSRCECRARRRGHSSHGFGARGAPPPHPGGALPGAQLGVRRRCPAPTGAASALDPKDYVAAQEERERLRLAMCELLDEVDVLLGRGAPPAPRVADCRPSATPSGKTRLR